MEKMVFSPTDFVALVNQTLDFAYPFVTIVGELANFKVSRGKWAYFDLKDEISNVKFFGTVFNLPGPLEDGMMVEVSGRPQLSPKYGFSITFDSIKPVGEGSLKKAADLLYAKLEKEGLFDIARKRPLVYPPSHIGLITSSESAAYSDFIKIMDSRFGAVTISLADVAVQGDSATAEIIQAIETINQLASSPEVIVLIRGGGSREDLAVFNSEQLVRSIALSRIPVLVAIGHERDISLAELVADRRCSTPSHAAETLVPDKKHESESLTSYKTALGSNLNRLINLAENEVKLYSGQLADLVIKNFNDTKLNLLKDFQLVKALDPKAPIKKGYSIVRLNKSLVSSSRQLKIGDELSIEFRQGKAKTKVKSVE